MERVEKAWIALLGQYAEEEITIEKQLILLAQCIHRPQLKSPTQGVYPGFDEFDVEKLDEELWSVSGYCDAPNSYGALTRDKFHMILRFKDDVFDFVVPKEKVHSVMIAVVATIGIVIFGLLGCALL